MSESAAVGAGLVIGLLIFMLVVLVVSVVTIVAEWKMFVKMGKPGWAVLIPFYNTYVLGTGVFSKSWKTWGLLISSIACFVIGMVSGAFSGTLTYSVSTPDASYVSSPSAGGVPPIISILVSVASLVYFVFSIMSLISLSKAFGKGVGFVIGLIFLGPIFFMILGFSSNSRYIGPDGIPAAGYGAGGGFGQQPYDRGGYPQQQYGQGGYPQQQYGQGGYSQQQYGQGGYPQQQQQQQQQYGQGGYPQRTARPYGQDGQARQAGYGQEPASRHGAGGDPRWGQYDSGDWDRR